MKLSRRIFGGMAAAALLTAVAATIIVTALMYGSLSGEIRNQVKNEAVVLSGMMNDGSTAVSAAGVVSRNRVTLIAPDGTVKYDNYSDYSDMENHLLRPEVQEALKSGSGESVRTSSTFGKKTYYYAVRLGSGDVLRMASETSSMFGTMVTAMPGILFSVIVLLALAMAAAAALTRRIITPINKLNLDAPMSAEVYEELSPLLVRIDAQNTEMREQINAVYEAQRENEYITRHMNDGLIMIAPDGRVILANESAEKIFGYRFRPTDSYLSICRDRVYCTAAEKALRGEAGEAVLNRGDRAYSLSYSAVTRDFLSEKNKDGIFAALIFVRDITEKEAAEKMRREFSANVSHELKTPLTSIMGCSEIMKEGIARPEDMPRFLGQINSEAKRLLALIDDIIRLSSLDEGGAQAEMSKVDLSELSHSAVDALSIKAQQNGIETEVIGSEAVIRGNSGLLYEMVYNLCDNAVRYNKPGGSLQIETGVEDGIPFVAVRDNGIGIPEEEQARIFERFYRVDKSHSKETGGTGLGLSIVKHVAMIHGGRIMVRSSVGCGTEIKIVFEN